MKNTLLERADLKIVSSIPNDRIKKLDILPMYKENKKIVCITTNKKSDGLEYLKYLFDTNLEIKELNKDIYEEVFNGLVKSQAYEENEIINDAINRKVSDIHFEPYESEVKVRFRIDGELSIFHKIKIEKYREILSRIKIKSNMDITEKRMPQDGKSTIKIEDEKYNIRISTIPTLYGEKMVIRILYNNLIDYKLESLDLSKVQLENLEKIIDRRNGVVIVTGPTGSGKSTTLYTILQKSKKDFCNITTIEDPVEVEIKNINQISLDRKVGLDFSTGLRSILRQDPDIIMVGEIRDEETAKIAIRAAITGHKVYSTIHTKSAREVYLRLEEMGVKNYLIKDAIVGIVSQRLVKSLCNNCKKEDKNINIDGKEYKLYKERGCKECNYSGIKGRKLVCSVHYIDGETRENLKEIYEDKSILSNYQMYERIKEYLLEGIISMEEYKKFILGEELENYEEIF